MTNEYGFEDRLGCKVCNDDYQTIQRERRDNILENYKRKVCIRNSELTNKNAESFEVTYSYGLGPYHELISKLKIKKCKVNYALKI